MKLKVSILLLLLFAAFACSDDEAAKPSYEDVQLSTIDSDYEITIPTGWFDEGAHTYAQVARNYLQIENDFADFLPPLIPGTATRTRKFIHPTNAESVFSESRYPVLYTWTREDTHTEMAYQVSTQGDAYVFATFVRRGDAWLLHTHAIEKKDQSSGFMNIYAIDDEGEESEYFTYSWSKHDNIREMMYDDGFVRIESTYDLTTKGGSIESFMSSNPAPNIIYHIDWEADGSGAWKSYQNGNQTGSGSW
jgi:hypothetical protein